MTTYYVTTSGSDSNNGLTEGTAFATPGYAAGQASSGDTIYVKDGTYTLTTATANVSGGSIDLGANKMMQGYLSTAGDQGAKPVINCGSVAPSIVCSITGTNNETNKSTYVSIEVDGNSQNVTAFTAPGSYFNPIRNCVAKNASFGFQGTVFNSVAESCTTGFGSPYGSNSGKQFSFCVAKSCTTGFQHAININNCIAFNCSGFGFDSYSSLTSTYFNCTAYGNNYGFGAGSAGYSGYNLYSHCVAVNNTTYGFYADCFLNSCAAYNNGTDFMARQSPDFFLVNQIALAADPFVNAPTDFGLNDIAGGGAELKNQNMSLHNVGTSYLDVGALQSQAPSGGGGATTHPLRSN
jgi:hypothetical protein